MPEKAKEPRHKTRISAYPPISGGQHLLEVLFEAGPAQVVGMGGLSAISELEMLAWQANRGISLTGFEVSLIRRLSGEYATMATEARSPQCPAPYTPPKVEVTAEERERIAREMERWADALNGQRSKRTQ